jgi:hypothetical protein
VKLYVLMDCFLAVRSIALPRPAQAPGKLTSPASDRDIRTGIVCGQVVTSKRQLYRELARGEDGVPKQRAGLGVGAADNAMRQRLRAKVAARAAASAEALAA